MGRRLNTERKDERKEDKGVKLEKLREREEKVQARTAEPVSNTFQSRTLMMLAERDAEPGKSPHLTECLGKLEQ